MHIQYAKILGILAIPLFLAPAVRADIALIQSGQASADIVVDTRQTQGQGSHILADSAQWLATSLQSATGVSVPVVDKLGTRPALILARAEAWPKVAKAAGLKPGAYGAYGIVTQPTRVYILGNSEVAVRHGVADLLRRWGFRWFAPSPRWHAVPKLRDVVVNVNVVDTPALMGRSIWYAYGMPGNDLRALQKNYTRWAIANRLSVGRLFQTGHSYGNIIGRNKKLFEQHPEYFALLSNGKRDNERSINARKFCVSNLDLIELVIQDRLRLLEANRRVNPAAFMVSVDPSDGEGTCHCDNCKKLGTTTDRVIHLANHVARGLRKKHPNAWVGLYAYSTHRLPPTIAVEPNVYVQVAMGFNRTKYTLPELIERWSKKVGAIGLREYYGVEAWDWGLPGRMRGGRVAYHRKWIPYYAARKLNAINAETNANWGGQTLGLYVAAQLMWRPKADVDALVDDFYQKCFDDVAKPMRELYKKFDAAPPLRAGTLLPMFRDVQTAWQTTKNPAVRERLVDVMAYLVYVAKFREFDLTRSRQAKRGKAYYDGLLPLMTYAWRIRQRDMVHYYALARRLCNGLPVSDKRLDFYMFNKKTPPVWQQGEQLTDAQIVALFETTRKRLEADGDPTVAFSRYLEPVRVAGQAAAPSRILGDKTETRDGLARFRKGLRGYLVPSGKQTVHFGVAPTARSMTFTVYLRGDTILFQKELRQIDKDKNASQFHDITVELARANEYRVEITGSFVLRVPPATPFVFEASATRPAWIDYSGPHYFYVPRGTKELLVDAQPRLSLFVPSRKKRLDITAAQRVPGKEYAVIPVPKNTAGQIWRTSNMTRGQVSLLNVPPLLSFHRHQLFVPREVAEADGLTTRK